MPNLYELASEFAALQAAADNHELSDEELTQLLDAIDESRLSLRDKVDNIAKLLASMDGDVEAFKREEHRINRRRKAMENKIERLRDWVRTTMDVLDVSDIKTDVHQVQIQPGNHKVIITDANKVPDEYIKTTRTPMKKAILAAYKDDGEFVPGTDIVRGDPKLVIR